MPATLPRHLYGMSKIIGDVQDKTPRMVVARLHAMVIFTNFVHDTNFQSAGSTESSNASQRATARASAGDGLQTFSQQARMYSANIAATTSRETNCPLRGIVLMVWVLCAMRFA